ncbi:16S rRNA (guanine(527)-N(7))-methyltransferase RsmG [Actimicrobium sp. CCI2.3]|uniref:16S rRNA (guanine(527)-N(7))-methyltransferase RsmG n=1 Tax=Actimicrobium sp. CCI2.3 TaxID=3048616 RepID=UPI002AB4A8F5|nr:16S rRNA (guanine(527)-N(7))-methyltransferase RsmG [Actimicrobium sp. CCI2.3]MDY7573116.1 16S rRNA (guanine(527)-N(7))-methyltransferase RsmG [Actimicrobium sp. CCI2.3]MEB0021146.1 16S rRNA (guanine(527)-N(7))-methyltransferase RsmG [Actimicrobium sp. CCI2.3]
MTTSFNRIELIKTLSDGATSLNLQLDATTLERLIDYLALLTKWNAVYNLTAVRDPLQMVTQHLLDTLTILPAFFHVKNVLDVGSGGGLPGMVLAIWAQQENPAMRISMVDTVHKKTAFLTQAKAELGLTNVTVHTGRVEALDVAQPFDVITSRAFAELADFVNWSGHLLAEQGRFIAMKGQIPVDEITRLPAGWKVTEIRPLQVPGLKAERHLIFIARDQKA